MKKIIFLLSVFLTAFISGLTWAEDAAVKQASKFYIIPIENIKNSKPNSFQLVVFKSIHSFMRIIPTLDVPDDKLMNDLFWLAPALERWDRISADHAPKEVNAADYILYGDYEIKQKDPEKVVIKIGVWSKAENKNVFTKSYTTGTDIEIFDTIDMILKNVIEGVLKIDYTLAKIDFDIKTGAEKYDIYINNKHIDTADKKDYQKGLSVLAGQTYAVKVVRSRDGKTVIAAAKTLAAKETLPVSYFANGSVVIDPVSYGERGRSFTYTVDGKTAYENQFISNMNALSSHSIKVVDQNSNLIYQGPFNVMDDATTHVYSEQKWGGAFHVKAFMGNTSFAGLGVEYFPWRYFWLEAGGGFSVWNSQYEIAPYIDAGYYLYGDMQKDFRAGLGLSAAYYQYLPAASFGRPYNYSAGIFAVGEWNWITLKLGLDYDFGAGQIFPVLSIGFKL